MMILYGITVSSILRYTNLFDIVYNHHRASSTATSGRLYSSWWRMDGTGTDLGGDQFPSHQQLHSGTLLRAVGLYIPKHNTNKQ